MMRDLRPEEIMLVVGGDGEGGWGGPITVIGHPPGLPPTIPGSPTYPGGGGSGGGTPPAPPTTSPIASLLQGYTKVTIGKHNVYLPADLANDTQAEKNAVQHFEDAIKNIDAKVNSLNDNATIQVTETWTDSQGTHTTTVGERAGDYKATWNKESFAILPDATYNSSSVTSGLASNNSGRGSSSIGADPNLAGNNVSAFALDTTVVTYDANNGTSGEQYLALHETAHQSAAGLAMNTATGSKNFNDFTQGSSNYANENLANTLALSYERSLGLNLGNYSSATGVTGGWQTGDTWTYASPP